MALAAYAGSAIAKADPMKTGFNATKLAIAAFIVPYIFAISPQMLFVDVSSAFPGGADLHHRPCSASSAWRPPSTGISTGRSPWCCGWPWAVGGLCMMIPGTVSDVIGFALVLGILLYQRLSARRTAA